MIKLTGVATARRNLKIIEKQLDLELRESIGENAKEVFLESQRRVPVDTTRLQQSGDYEHRAQERKPGLFTSRIGYGYKVPYAIHVHEMNKNYYKPGSSWKFLELAINNNKSRMKRKLKDDALAAIKKALRRAKSK